MNKRWLPGLFLMLLVSQIQAQVQARGKLELSPLEPGSNGVMAQLFAVATAPPVYEQKNGVIQDLSTTGVRGGYSSERPLGQYLVRPYLEYKSEYRNEKAENMCRFAYDLHLFVRAKGRDYDSVLWRENGARKLTGSSVNQGYLPVAEQKEFARSWWTRSKRYKELSESAKESFVDEAVIDATNLYGWYGRRVYGTAAYVAWQEGFVRALVQKPGRACD